MPWVRLTLFNLHKVFPLPDGLMQTVAYHRATMGRVMTLKASRLVYPWKEILSIIDESEASGDACARITVNERPRM